MSPFEIIGMILLLLGTLICIIGGIGLLRLPNFFARVHAASIPDTLGAGLCLLGMIFLTFGLTEQYDTFGMILIIVKLISIGVFIFVTSPIAGHALVKAAYRNGLAGKISPMDGEDKPETSEAGSEI